MALPTSTSQKYNSDSDNINHEFYLELLKNPQMLDYTKESGKEGWNLAVGDVRTALREAHGLMHVLRDYVNRACPKGTATNPQCANAFHSLSEHDRLTNLYKLAIDRGYWRGIPGALPEKPETKDSRETWMTVHDLIKFKIHIRREARDRALLVKDMLEREKFKPPSLVQKIKQLPQKARKRIRNIFGRDETSSVDFVVLIQVSLIVLLILLLTFLFVQIASPASSGAPTITKM